MFAQSGFGGSRIGGAIGGVSALGGGTTAVTTTDNVKKDIEVKALTRYQLIMG